MNFDKINDPMVREYMRKKYENEQKINDAQDMQDVAGYAGVATQLLNDFNKSQRKDVILHNRLQDLGKAPTVKEDEVNTVDPNIASNLAKIGVDKAKENANRDQKDFNENLKLDEYTRKKDQVLKSRDPNSEESKQAREFMKYVAPSLGEVPGFDTMSAEKLEKVSPVLMQKYRADKSAEATKNRMDVQRQNQKYNRQVQQDKETEKNVQKLSKDVKGIQGINNSVKSVEDVLGFNLDDYDPKTNTVNGKPLKDLPGVSVPGVGRVSFYDSDARTLSASISKVFNTELKDRSGAAVTTPEMERLKTEFQSGKFNTEEEMIAAIKTYKELAMQELANREAAYSSEVKDTYKERGGQTSDSFKDSDHNTINRLPSMKASDLP